MASEYFQTASWDGEILWQIYPQIPSDDEASRQMYGPNNYPTQPQIPSDDEASRQMYGLSNYPTQPQILSDDEASRQMYGLNNYPTQLPQIPSDDEASRQLPQVQPIFALPTARPQRIQQPALGRKLSPLTPKQPKGKPKPPKYLTDEERQEICQIHEDNPSATKTGTGGIFGVNRTTISSILKNKEKYLQHGGASHPSVKHAERKPPNIGRKLTGSAPLRPKQPSLRRNEKKTLRRTLTDEERRKICQTHKDFPSTKQKETARHFGFERSTISKLLKHKEKYLQHSGASHHSVKHAERKPANIGRALEIWALRAETLGIQLTGSAIEEKARIFASVGNEESFLQSTDFEEFKQRRRVDGLPSPPSKILNEGELAVDINKAAPLSGLGPGVSSVLPPTLDEARDALKTLLLYSREESLAVYKVRYVCVALCKIDNAVPTVPIWSTHELQDSPVLSASALVGATILSRVGLRGLGLCIQFIIREDVEAAYRGSFSSVEAAWQNAFELCSLVSTIIFSRTEQFKWPSLFSVVATVAVCVLCLPIILVKTGP